MSETKTLKCNCGCGKTAGRNQAWGWLILDQMPPQKRGDDLKLDEVLHFASIDCLAVWSAKAVEELPELQNSAKRLHPRGEISTTNCEGFHI